MTHSLRRLWQDDCGALIATEWVFVATILVLGSIVGLKAVNMAVSSQLNDFADATMSLDQSYFIEGRQAPQAATAGSIFNDSHDLTINAGGVTVKRSPNIWPQEFDPNPCD